MSDLMRSFKTLRRSKLLIRAARIAVANYRRDTDLRRLLKSTRLPTNTNGMINLLALEQELEADRKIGKTTYSIAHHVEVLAALMAEAGLLDKSRRV